MQSAYETKNGTVIITSMRMPRALLQKAQEKAAALEISRPEYIRRLIERDLGLRPYEVPNVLG